MDGTGRFPWSGSPRHLGRGTDGRAATARRVDPSTVARRLGAVVHWPGAAGVRDRSWRLIAQTRDFDAWLIAWPCGSAAELHDHGGSRGALHVIGGSLVETIPWRGDEGEVALARREVRAGVTLPFGAGHVHDVRNEAADHALSIHVYSPPLQSMTYYDRFGDRLVPRENGWVTSRDQAALADRSLSRLPAP
ncbi:MAG TPA: cysteine dioxygenase family protein [Acidimicrobiales bacterium]|nr:cysteine dioxygenase family protein [Acidimicrobiales bacterium]